MTRKVFLVLLALVLALCMGLVGCGQSAAAALVSECAGDLFVVKEDTVDWTEAEVGMALEPTDIIKCGDNSSAEITFLDGSTIELEAGTEVEVAELVISTETDSAIIRLKLVIGSIIFRVVNIVDPSSRYEVETPTGEVAIRGSAVQITVSEDGTTLACNLEGEIWAIAQGVELQIPEGECCTMRIGQPPELIVVAFADPNLEVAIREAIGKPTGNIYPSDLEWLTYLEAYERNITDLTGLEHCTSLTVLYLGYNQISDISALADLTSLTLLFLEENQISDISSLASLTNLTILSLYINQVSDISPLANLTSLTSLSLSQNDISDISALADLTRLTYLNLAVNQISDISALADLTSLIRLYLSNNQISDISPLTNLTGLTDLRLSVNQITDVSPLTSLTGLTVLELRTNQINDISPVANLRDLTWLTLGYNQISDISALANLTSLTELWLQFNQISDISPLANLTNLEILWIRDNQISDISALANLTSLTELNLMFNQISDISPLVDNEGLSEGDYVSLYGNPLSSDSINMYIPQLRARGVSVDSY